MIENNTHLHNFAVCWKCKILWDTVETAWKIKTGLDVAGVDSACEGDATGNYNVKTPSPTCHVTMTSTNVWGVKSHTPPSPIRLYIRLHRIQWNHPPFDAAPAIELLTFSGHLLGWASTILGPDCSSSRPFRKGEMLSGQGDAPAMINTSSTYFDRVFRIWGGQTSTNKKEKDDNANLFAHKFSSIFQWHLASKVPQHRAQAT